MGCASSKAVSKTTEVKEAAPCTLLQRTAPEIGKTYPGNPYEDMDHTKFVEILKTEKIAVVKASYFERCLSDGVPFEDRSAIPPEYFVKGDDVIDMWKRYGADYLVIFSYAWLTAQHPDPDLFHLKTIVSVLRAKAGLNGHLDRNEAIGVIIDYCSFWQRGHSEEDKRTAAQVKEFHESLQEINTPYAHQEITAIKLMAVPAEVQRKYDDRGWTLFESILIDGKASSKMYSERTSNVVVLGVQLDPALVTIQRIQRNVLLYEDLAMGRVWEVAIYNPFRDIHASPALSSKRSPPMTPERFNLEMEKRKSRAQSKGVPLFTNGSDQPFILDKYVAAFGQQVLAKNFSFDNMAWSQLADIECLVEVLVHCQELQLLDLSFNFMGDECIAELSKGLVHLRNLKELYLHDNGFGDAGGEKLVEAVRDMPNLQTLDLQDTHAYKQFLSDAMHEKLRAATRDRNVRCLFKFGDRTGRVPRMNLDPMACDMY